MRHIFTAAFILLAAAFALHVAATPAAAQTRTWDANGTIPPNGIFSVANNWNPDFVRLYPTLVIRNTQLFQMYREGKFVPWSMERTLENLKTAVNKYREKDIPVIRMGLHPDPSMLENYVDGPYHPSLRYLVDCRIGLDEMIDNIRSLEKLTKTVKFIIPFNSTSIYIGHKHENIQKLKEKFHLEKIILQPESDCERLQLIA